jgi:hypothetical protein
MSRKIFYPYRLRTYFNKEKNDVHLKKAKERLNIIFFLLPKIGMILV